MLEIISISLLILFGGFYNWSVMLVGVVLAAFLLVKKQEVFCKGQSLTYTAYIPLCIFVLGIITQFVAVDKGLHLIGLAKVLVIIFALFFLAGIENEDKEKTLMFLPYAGAVMTVLCLLALLFETTKNFLWQADRLGGIFQYSNTCALFYLICIIILSYGNYKKTWHIVLLASNLLGLLLTGSRSVMLLLIAYGIYRFITEKTSRKNVGLAAAILALVMGVGTFAFGKSQNIGRLFTLATQNSTVYGRLLYYKDALQMLIRHPFGLGFMGYYYIQGSEQTGVYVTQFVHNDFLQMALDCGILAGILLIVFLAMQLFKGKQGGLQKNILAFGLVASLVDIHMQYFLIIWILLLCLDTDLLFEGKDKNHTKKMGNIKLWTSIGMLVICSYFGLVSALESLGSYGALNNIYSLSTSAKENLLTKVEDADEAKQLCDEILKINKYSFAAYDNYVYLSLMVGDLDEAFDYMDKALSVDKYSVDNYVYFNNLLSQLEIEAVGASDFEGVEIINEKKKNLREQLAAQKDTTSPLAYKIKDKPVFEY